MKNRFLLSALLLHISFGLMLSCKSSNQPNKQETAVQEMPKPATDNNIDSLKQIQQHKRDSVKQLKIKK